VTPSLRQRDRFIEFLEAIKRPQSRITVAVRAGLSEPSVKCFGLDPETGVTPRVRRKLEPVYAALASELQARA